MTIKNTARGYGWPSIVLHWAMAVALIGLYFVGDYMVGLDYYDDLYHTLPHWHKSVGMLLAVAWLARLVWNYSHARPAPADPQASKHETLAAHLAHLALYALVGIMLISGYMISTAKGADIEVFNWFSVPALVPNNAERGEFAGEVHEIVGTIFVALVAVHALAALFHHFVRKDNTLKRMLNSKGNTP